MDGGGDEIRTQSRDLQTEVRLLHPGRAWCPIPIQAGSLQGGLRNALWQDRTISFPGCAHIRTPRWPCRPAWTPTPVHSLMQSPFQAQSALGPGDKDSGTSRRFVFCGHCNWALSCLLVLLRDRPGTRSLPTLCSPGEKSLLKKGDLEKGSLKDLSHWLCWEGDTGELATSCRSCQEAPGGPSCCREGQGGLTFTQPHCG